MSGPPSVEEGAAEDRFAPESRTALAVVFTTILVDFIGFSILIPVLPLYADDLGAGGVKVGLILSLYALAQLLFLPAWGWVSDRIGRRPVILTSLFGTALSFAVLVVGDSLVAIYVSRVLAGFFAASIGTAQAVVTDLTPASQRARGMGLIGAAFGLGFVVGPALGGILAGIHLRLPFVTVMALALVNLAVAWRRLPESRPPRPNPPPWRDLLRTLVPVPLRLAAAVHERRIGLYLYLFFHLFTAFAALESMFALYLKRRFDLGFQDAGVIFSYIGVFIAVTQGALVGRLVRRFGESAMVTVGLLATGVGLTAVAFVPSPGWFYLVGPIIAVGNGISFPTFTSLYSQACRHEKAGELLGESQSMATAGRIVGPIWAGFALGSVSLGAPFVIAGVLMLLALALFWMAHGVLVGDEA